MTLKIVGTHNRILNLLESAGLLRDNHKPVVPSGRPKGEWVSANAREKAAERLRDAARKRDARIERARQEQERVDRIIGSKRSGNSAA